MSALVAVGLDGDLLDSPSSWYAIDAYIVKSRHLQTFTVSVAHSQYVSADRECIVLVWNEENDVPIFNPLSKCYKIYYLPVYNDLRKKVPLVSKYFSMV